MFRVICGFRIKLKVEDYKGLEVWCYIGFKGLGASGLWGLGFCFKGHSVDETVNISSRQDLRSLVVFRAVLALVRGSRILGLKGFLV